MLTAIYAARNILGGRYDLWSVNVDAEYHEAGVFRTEDNFEPQMAEEAARLLLTASRLRAAGEVNEANRSMPAAQSEPC